MGWSLEEVSDGPAVHGQVPRLPEVEHVVGVPPVAVELSVSEAQNLDCHGIRRSLNLWTSERGIIFVTEFRHKNHQVK